jgi:hypothetical protein
MGGRIILLARAISVYSDHLAAHEQNRSDGNLTARAGSAGLIEGKGHGCGVRHSLALPQADMQRQKANPCRHHPNPHRPTKAIASPK